MKADTVHCDSYIINDDGTHTPSRETFDVESHKPKAAGQHWSLHLRRRVLGVLVALIGLPLLLLPGPGLALIGIGLLMMVLP